MQTLNQEQKLEGHPKVLVGCPTSVHKRYCLGRYARRVKELTYPNYDLLIVDNSENNDYIGLIKESGLPAVKDEYSDSARERIINSRNILRKEVLEKYDYFLSLEQDVIPPKDIIERMLKSGKKLVTGVYYNFQMINGKNQLRPLLWKRIGKDRVKALSFEEIEGGSLMEVGACGLGCLLIDKEILKNIKFRYDPNDNGFDDMWFCQDTFNQGHKIFADTSLKCKHLIKGGGWEGIKK